MKILNSKWKYLILIPIIFLIANGIYFRHAAKEIQNALFSEKYREAVDNRYDGRGGGGKL